MKSPQRWKQKLKAHLVGRKKDPTRHKRKPKK